MRSRILRQAAGPIRPFCTESLEPRTLFSGPPITPAPQAQVDVSGVQALLTDPIRSNIVYMLTDRRVTAIDTGLGRTIDWANIQANGRSIAVSPAGDRLYVAEPNAFAIEVLSLPDLRPVTTLHLGVAPGAIAAGVNNQVYVATNGGQSQQLVQVDALTGVSASRFALWGSNELRATPDGTRLYNTMIEGGSGGGLNVDEYDISGGTPLHTDAYPIDYANSQDFEVDPVHRRVFTANGGVYGVGVTLMDSKFKTSWSFDGPPYATAVTLSPDYNTVYGSSGSPYDGVIQSFDIATGNRTANYATAPYAVQKGLLAATANGRILYVGSNSNSGQHLVLIGGTSLAVDDIPTARASASVTPSNGSATVSFDGTASSAYGLGQALTSYTWNFGDGQFGTGPTPQHTYSAPGTYNVTLTVTGSTGLSDDITLPLTLSVSANPNGPYSVLVDQSILLTAAGSHSDFGDIATYEWDTDYNGTTFTPDLTGSNPTFDANGLLGNTSRNLALRVTDTAGNVKITTTSLLISAINVTANHGGTYGVVAGKSITFDGRTSSSNFGPIVTYEWDTDYDGTTFSADLTGPAPTFDAAGLSANTSRTIALRVTDSGGHVGLSTTTLYVVAPTVVADPGGPYYTIAGGTVSLNSPASSSNFGPVVTYEWDTNYHAGGPFTPRATGPSVDFSTAGLAGPLVLTIALRVTDSGGNSNISTSSLYIDPVSIFARFVGPTYVISGNPVQLSDYGSSSNLGPIVSYDWDTAYDGTTFVPRATGANPVISSAGWPVGTSHTVALRVTDVGGNQAFATLNIQVFNVPDDGGGLPVPAQPTDTTPPTAVLSSIPAPTLGSSATQFTVTYSDASGVNLSSLDGADILIRGPRGFTQLARFVSAVPTDSSHQTVTATYEILAPTGVWDGAANGTYTLSLNANQVTENGSFQAAPAGVLGAFAVNLAPPDAPDLRVAFIVAPAAKLTAGDALRLSIRLSNLGTRNLSTSKISVRLFASTDPILDDGDLSVGTLTKQVALKKGASQVWTFSGTAPKVPTTGKYYLLAQADSGSSIKERNEDNNLTSTATRIVARAPDLAVEFAVKPARYSPGQYVAASFRLTNTGNDVAKGLLPVRIYAMDGSRPQPDTDLLVLDTSFSINLRPGARKVLPAYFPAPSILSGRSGYFYIVIDGSAVGDKNMVNDGSISHIRVAILKLVR